MSSWFHKPERTGRGRTWRPRLIRPLPARVRGDMRSTIRALIVANEYLETEVSEVMKACLSRLCAGKISHTYSG